MIKPTHIRHLLPLGIALTTGVPLAPVVGWSLIAFTCAASPPSRAVKSTIGNALLALVDVAEVIVSVGAYFYALMLAVGP